MDVPVEATTFAVQDVTFLVLGGLSYEQIIETARSSKIFTLSEAFWRAKVLRILGLSSMEVGRIYAAQLGKDRDNRIAYFAEKGNFVDYVPPYADLKAAKVALRAMDNLASQSILACRIPYVRVLYAMNPQLLREQKLSKSTKSGVIKCNKAAEAMKDFLLYSKNYDCIAAYGKLFAQDPYFISIAKKNLPKAARDVVGVPGKATLDFRTLFDNIDELLASQPEELLPEAVADLLFRGLRHESVIASDFQAILQPKYLDLVIKNTKFYHDLCDAILYSETPCFKAKRDMLKGTSICQHRPIHLLISGTHKQLVKIWLALGLSDECIVPLQLVRVDVTAKFVPIFMPLFHSKGHRTQSPELELVLQSRTLVLCWTDQEGVEHSYRITMKTYRTLCDIIFHPSSHYETAEYMKSLLAANLGTLQIFELYWTFDNSRSTDEVPFRRPIGGSAVGNQSRESVYRSCKMEMERYTSGANLNTLSAEMHKGAATYEWQ